MKEKLIRLLYRIISTVIYKIKQVEILHLKFTPNTFIDSTFRVGAGSYLNIEKDILELRIEKNVVMRKSCNILMYPDSSLVIQESVFFNNYCSINCLGKIEIGANTMFGEGVKLYDHNHLYYYGDFQKLSIERNSFKIGKIKIGKNCWIGSNVTILNNVEIGDNVIIGANCLIHENISSHSVVKFNNSLIIS